MLSLVDLEPEVVFLIIEFVNDSSPKSTKAVACVNRYFNEVTKLIGHRHKTIIVHDPLTAMEVVNTWNRDEIVLANIRTLTVKGWRNERRPPTYDKEFWEPLVTLLSKAGKLRMLDWSIKHPLPVTVLDALEENQPGSSLRIFNFTRDSGDLEPSKVEQRLAESTALIHLHCGSKYPASQEVLGKSAFRYITGSAPNLVYAGMIRSAYRIRPPVPKLGTQPEGISPTPERPNSSVRRLTLDGIDVSRYTLIDWSSIVDLDSLHNVKFSRGVPTLDYFQYAADALPNLKHLSLNLFHIRYGDPEDEKELLYEAIADYINDCSPLETLSLWSWMDIVSLSNILQQHGASLKNLQLHEREDSPTGRQVLEVADIINIRNGCPHLQKFTFDLNRDDPRLSWEQDTKKQYYEELAKFPSLNSLQIYFDVGAAYLLYSNKEDPYDTEDPYADYNEDSDDGYREDNENERQPVYVNGIYTDSEDEAETGNENNNNNNNTGEAAQPIPHSSNTIANPPSSPPSEPPAKKARRERDLQPSRDVYLSAYAKSIWKTVFGNKVGGARRLDIKVGEWEGQKSEYPGAGGYEWQFRRHIVVRPHERDDVFEPDVKLHRLPLARD